MITYNATRTERRVDEVPAAVTVAPAAEIEAAGARDIKDLFRNQVDLSVRAAPGRFGAAQGSTGRAGNEGLNICGLEGNQVLILVHGIRVPGSFSFSSFATGRADYLALEAAQAAEVLRGPASTSFGSDGLAGALSLRTLDPADLLKAGQTMGGFVRQPSAWVKALTDHTMPAALLVLPTHPLGATLETAKLYDARAWVFAHSRRHSRATAIPLPCQRRQPSPLLCTASVCCAWAAIGLQPDSQATATADQHRSVPSKASRFSAAQERLSQALAPSIR